MKKLYFVVLLCCVSGCTSFSFGDKDEEISAALFGNLRMLTPKNGKPDAFAVLIGGKERSDMMANCEPTAAHSVLNRRGFAERNIVHLGRRPYGICASSLSAVRASLIALVESVDSEDIVVVNYTGHGMRGTVRLQSGEDFSAKEFRELLADIHPKLGVAIIDACGSGPFRENPPPYWVVISGTTSDTEVGFGGLQKYFFEELDKRPSNIQEMFDAAKTVFAGDPMCWWTQGPQFSSSGVNLKTARIGE